MTKAEKFSRFADTKHVRENLKRKSIHGVLFMLSGGAIDFIVRFASTCVMARILSPTEFGLLAMVVAVTAIADQYAELGLPSATIQARELSHEQVSKLFWINFGAGCLLFAIFCGLAPVIAQFYKNPSLVPLTLAISTTFIAGGLTSQHQALLSRQLKQGHMSAVRLTASVVSLAFSIILALNHFGVWALAWREVARAFLVAAGMWLACPWIPGFPRRDADIKGLLRYGSHLTVNQIVIGFVEQLDRLLVGRFAGPAALGIYRQAQQLMIAPFEHLLGPVFSVASPGLSVLQADSDRYKRYYERIALVLSLASMPIGLFVTVCAEEITNLLLGPKWVGTVPFLQIFGLVAFLRPVLESSSVVMMTYGLSKRLLVISVASNLFLAALMFAGVPWGAIGIAWANVIAIVVSIIPRLHYSFRRTPVTLRGFLYSVSPPAIASVLMAVSLLLLKHFRALDGVTWSLFLYLPAGGILFAVALLLVPHGRSEVLDLTTAVINSLGGRPLKAADGTKEEMLANVSL
jgi:O-antigen/teichoic acid export membrane protein